MGDGARRHYTSRMIIQRVLFPIVTDAPAPILAFYRDALGLDVLQSFDHAGFHVDWLGPLVVVSAHDPAALAVPRQVQAIFVVDDLDACWRALAPQATVLQAPWRVPTGRAFVVRQPDGRTVEYLELAA